MRGRIRVFWLILAIVLAVAAGGACAYAGLFGSIYNQPDADPAETVTRFFECIRAGDYSGAYDCLSDYSSLGLELEPESTDARQIYDALRLSYSFRLDGGSTVSGLEATQRVTLRALNIRMTEAAIARQVDAVVEELVSTLPTDEVYDSDSGGYLTSFTDAVYAEALNRALQNPDGLCTDTALNIRLIYQGGAWKIITDRSLMAALVGGET